MANVGSGKSHTFRIAVRPSSSAPDRVEGLTFRLTSDNAPTEGWGDITVDGTFVNVEPALYITPSSVQSGVACGNAVYPVVNIKNSGYRDMEAPLNLSLVPTEGELPSWAKIYSMTNQPPLAEGESRDIQMSFAPGADVEEGYYGFDLVCSSEDLASDRHVRIWVTVNNGQTGGLQLHVSDYYTGTPMENGQETLGLKDGQLARVRLVREDGPLSEEHKASTDPAGNLLVEELPVGTWTYRVSASGHDTVTGKITVKPGVTEALELFLPIQLVTVTWNVEEITLEDRYDIVLTSTFVTDVPFPVVKIEPETIRIPRSMKRGEVMRGEITFKNLGAIAAENLQYHVPASDDYYSFEIDWPGPVTLAPQAEFRVEYRITANEGVSERWGGDEEITEDESNPQPSRRQKKAGESERQFQNKATARSSANNSYGICSEVRRADYGYEAKCVNGHWECVTNTQYYLADVPCPTSSGSGPGPGTGSYGLSPALWQMDGPTGYVPDKIHEVESEEEECVGDPCEELGTYCCGVSGNDGKAGDPGNNTAPLNSSVLLINKAYQDDITDIEVKIRGGLVGIRRELYNNRWTFMETYSDEDIAKPDKTTASLWGASVRLETNAMGALTGVWDTSVSPERQVLWIQQAVYTNITVTTNYLVSRVYSSRQRDTSRDFNNGLDVIVRTNKTIVVRPVEVADAAEGTPGRRTVSYRYDESGNLTGVTDVAGYENTYEYDGLNRLIRKTRADGAVVELAYPAGALVVDGWKFTSRLVKPEVLSGKKRGGTISASSSALRTVKAVSMKRLPDPYYLVTITHPDGALEQRYIWQHNRREFKRTLNGEVVFYWPSQSIKTNAEVRMVPGTRKWNLPRETIRW